MTQSLLPLLCLLLSGCFAFAQSSKMLAKVIYTKEKIVPFEAYVSELSQKRSEVRGKAKPVHFEIIEQIERDSLNRAAWLEKYQLSIPAKVYHDEPALQCMQGQGLPAWVDKYVRQENNGRNYYLSHALQQEGYVLFFYGDSPDALHIVHNIALLVVRDAQSEAVRYAVDFNPVGMAPEYIQRDKQHVFQSIRWAYVEAGILYVENAHWRYAESSKGKNAYISAIDLSKGEMLWRSKPLVSNSVNFVVLDDVIVCGYGYTREGAKLFALDKQNGAIVGELELAEPDPLGKKHIEYIFFKNGRLHVKLFDRSEFTVGIQRNG